MKVIIAGGRDITCPFVVGQAVEASGFTVSEVVSGGARGVDSLGEAWAKANGVGIKSFPADWCKYGRGAGPIRNAEMAEYADALIAIWDGKSPGTADMVRRATEKCLKVYVYRTDRP